MLGRVAEHDYLDERMRYVRDLRDPLLSRRQLARSAERGEHVRLARGAYLPFADWQALDRLERYIARVRAVAATRSFTPVLSHWSAAAIHGLPNIGQWPDEVHVTVGKTPGGRSRNGVVKHSLKLDDEDVVECEGLLLTSVERTAIDIASTAGFAASVAVVDRAIHVDRRGRTTPLTTPDGLLAAWERALPFRAFARTRKVIDFAVTQSDSPLESVSRATMHLIGCPKPRLQTPYYDYRGLVGEVDFDWPEYRIVGETDGAIKYLDHRYRAGRNAEQVVYDEKLRADRLVSLGLRVTRWPWQTAMRPAALRAHLKQAGLPL